MVSRTTLSLIAVLALGAASVATAQSGTGTQPAQHRTTAGTTRQARGTQRSAQANVAVSRDSARTIALAQVPNAKVRSEKLQRHQGKLVYAFSLRAQGQTRSQRLYVDANTGEVTTPPATSSTGAASTHRSRSAHRTSARASDTSAHRAPTKKP